jgi:transcriptional regulator with XRE-family HTH domain
MTTLRDRARDRALARAARINARFGEELRLARMIAGLTQAALGRRAGVSQTTVSMAERGARDYRLSILTSLVVAAGHDLVVQVRPANGLTLRDRGQLRLAREIADRAHRTWRVELERPVAAPPDRRAADVVLHGAEEAVHIEICRALVDAQAQIRAGHLKREALERALGVAVRFVLALPGGNRTRRLLDEHGRELRTSLCADSRTVWRSIVHGVPLRTDGLVIVDPRPAVGASGGSTRSRARAGTRTSIPMETTPADMAASSRGRNRLVNR